MKYGRAPSACICDDDVSRHSTSVYHHVMFEPRPSPPFIAGFAHTQLHSACARAITVRGRPGFRGYGSLIPRPSARREGLVHIVCACANVQACIRHVKLWVCISTSYTTWSLAFFYQPAYHGDPCLSLLSDPRCC